jgi:CDP-diacylglycerol---serine O-phosphatidyltransferase
MRLLKHLPNFITCLNLLCGCLAILMVFESELIYASYFIGTAAGLDFLDGFAARSLKAYSEIGKQLDSLADMVSFGAAPGFIMYSLLRTSAIQHVFHNNNFNFYLLMIVFIIPVFSALRLAKFNIDTRQTDSFIGLPTPANAIFIASLPLILAFQPLIFDCRIVTLFNPYVLIGFSILMSFLLVSELPLFALKFKNMKWNDNKPQFIFLILSLLMLIIFRFIAIPLIVFLYIIISILSKKKTLPNP